MKANKLLRAAKVGVCWGVLCAQAAPVQSPGLARLVIASMPPGAKIAINGRAMPQQTDATFVVGPGKYSVEVSGGPGNLKCAAKEITVTAGRDTAVTCTSEGWAK